MPSTRIHNCSAIARTSGESLGGTALVSDAWLLWEQPGGWAADPMATAGLAGELADHLSIEAERIGFRILLIRRTSARTSGAIRTCFLVRSSPAHKWIRRLELTPESLPDLDLSVLASETEPPAGEPAGSVFLVCTHGKRDPCCAEYGRAVARALAGDDRVWESSHQGGHRFAANLACFPHGVSYGQVEPGDAHAVVQGCENGRLSLRHLRGRTYYSQPAQSADLDLRLDLGLTGMDDLRLIREQEAEPDVFELEFAGPGRSHRIRLRRHREGGRPESCKKDKLTPVTYFTRVG